MKRTVSGQYTRPTTKKTFLIGDLVQLYNEEYGLVTRVRPDFITVFTASGGQVVSPSTIKRINPIPLQHRGRDT